MPSGRPSSDGWVASVLPSLKAAPTVLALTTATATTPAALSAGSYYLCSNVAACIRQVADATAEVTLANATLVPASTPIVIDVAGAADDYVAGLTLAGSGSVWLVKR